MSDPLAQPNPFRWSSKAKAAAILIAEDDLSDRLISVQIGVSESTLARWKRHPEFQADVSLHVAAIEASMRRLAIAKKHKRIERLDDLEQRHREAIRLRAERYAPLVVVDSDLDADPPPEAATGLFVRKETRNNAGFTSVEWLYDAAIPKAIQSLYEQAAKELGQIIDKQDITHGGGVRIEIVGVDTELL